MGATRKADFLLNVQILDSQRTINQCFVRVTEKSMVAASTLFRQGSQYPCSEQAT
jgi:hypothetical protein